MAVDIIGKLSLITCVVVTGRYTVTVGLMIV